MRNEKINSLISKVKSKDDRAFSELAKQYTPLMKRLSSFYANKIFVQDQNKEDFYQDFLQESRLALYSAALSYDLNREDVLFGAYAKKCISNRIISKMRKIISLDNKKKKLLKKDITKEEKISIVQKDRDMVEAVESFGIDSLTDFEKNVLEQLASGKKVSEIAKETNKSTKSISNAAFRGRQKVVSYIKVIMPK